MPSITTQNAIMRPEMVMFYVLDTSGSMRGLPIAQLNRAMVNTIDTLRDEARHNRDARIKVAVLEFNTTCRWVQPAGPEDLEDFFWEDLQAAGLTYVGEALDELNSKLTNKSGGFINTTTGALMPVFIFMTDGYAVGDYEKALNKIRQNKWFSNATRVGFAIGKNPDIEMISKLAGSSEAVIRTEDLNLFAQMLMWVSVTSSVVSSKTKTSGQQNMGREAKRMACERLGFDPDDTGIDYMYNEEPMANVAWGPSMDDVFAGAEDWDSTNPF